MVTQQQNPASTHEVFYPESDGQPMSDNTKQFRWIVTIKENLEILFADDPTVFVAGNLLWYPVEGRNTVCQAPDAMVIFGRPKGDRGSYQQWKEDNIAPQVAFEILSPSNTPTEMMRKLMFYQQYGVEEYYVYDPDRNSLVGSEQRDRTLIEIPDLQGWQSPRLGIRFELDDETLNIYYPNGDRFLTSVELSAQRDRERERAEQADQRAEQADQRAEQADQRAEQERQRAEQERQRAAAAEARSQQLAEQLRSLGINPDTL
jgi:Uma2 family endonuclease